MQTIRSLSAITAKAIQQTRNKQFVSETEQAEVMQGLLSAVQTVAELRGDTTLFEASRPPDLIQFQKEMYYLEDTLRTQLAALRYEQLTSATNSSTPAEVLLSQVSEVNARVSELFDFPAKCDTQTDTQQLAAYTHQTHPAGVRVVLSKTQAQMKITVSRGGTPNSPDKESCLMATGESVQQLAYGEMTDTGRYTDTSRLYFDINDNNLKLETTLLVHQPSEQGNATNEPTPKVVGIDQHGLMPYLDELSRILDDVHHLVPAGEYVSESGLRLTIP